MNEINLLPQEMKPSGLIIKLSANLKKAAFLGVLILLISVSLSLGTYIFFSQRVSASLSNQEELKNQIKALERTEQRLVLVKDRLEKINFLNRQPRANDEVEKLNFVTGLFPQDTFVERIDLEKNNAKIAISSTNLDNIATYLASVISSGKYVQINLVSLEFNPLQGYIVELAFPE
jgi:hypothetical protein